MNLEFVHKIPITYLALYYFLKNVFSEITALFGLHKNFNNIN